MPSSDLDHRLRDAFALPTAPFDDARAMDSIASALPRYRGKRRVARGAAGASLLAVVGLAVGLAVGGQQGPLRSARTVPKMPVVMGGAKEPPRDGAAFSAPGFAADVPCVRVRIGQGAARCAGQVTPLPGQAPLATNAPQAGPSVTVQASAGQRVVISLPPDPGIT
jgi:hypothetical protein